MSRYASPLLIVVVALAAALVTLPRDGMPAVAQSPYVLTIGGLASDGLPEPDLGNYAVRPGETLRAVAHRHHTSVGVIAAMNGVGAGYVPRAGERLFVPELPDPAPGEIVYSGDRSSNRVALTLDMGGRVEPALDIMRFLIANNVRATIFMTGAMVDNRNTDAGRQVLALVEANLDLFELGNHSYSHPDFTTLTVGEMSVELFDTQSSIDEYVSLDTRPLFRPPFGAVDSRVAREVGELGFGELIMWDIDTIDWMPESDGGPTTAAIVNKVVSNAQGGSIVLMHLGGYNTYAALPGIVEGLRARGFDLSTVGEVLADQ